MQDRILKVKEVSALTTLARTSIYKYVKLGQFPKPLQLGGRSIGWPLSIINTWISSNGKVLGMDNKIKG